MATITSTGAWTVLTSLDTSKMTGMNVPAVLNLNLESLKQRDGTILPELTQFIQAMATGYSIDFWQAASLLDTLMKAQMNSRHPMVRGEDVDRMYIP